MPARTSSAFRRPGPRSFPQNDRSSRLQRVHRMAVKTHTETRLLPYTAQQMFDLVADVPRYPEFLPWCVGPHIKEQQPDILPADVMIGFKMVREKFSSRVWLHRPE